MRMDSSKLLEDLTEPQREAVLATDGPVLVVAGAGSGKTRVITRRVAHLISLGIPASSIVAITFTNKAANEMKSRVSTLMGRPLYDFGKLDQRWPIICTFHSLGLRILRHWATTLGLAPGFTVYDSADQERLIKQAIVAADLSTTHFTPGSVHSQISNAKNKLQTPDEFSKQAKGFYEERVAKIYRVYQRLLATNQAMDFDDLLMRCVLAFRSHQEILQDLQERFQYLLIDEYQDTNHAQYYLAHLLAMKRRNLCVVGDPDQSIYAWRGADIRNILDFEKDYPDAKVIRLEQNYRSTQTILRLASSLIAHNRQRKDKSLWTENVAGDPATLLLCADEHEEADEIAKRLQQFNKQGRPWSQMAVFYRINSLSRVVEDALRRRGIPHRVARGVAFYQRKEIKDVLAYLKAIANPDDALSLERIVNMPPRGIGDSTVDSLQAKATAAGVSLWEAMRQAINGSELPARAAKALGVFVHLMERWRNMMDAPDAAGKVRDLVEDVVRTSGLEAYLKKSATSDEREELENVDELVSSAAEFDQDHPEGTLNDYLAQVSLVSDVDQLKDNGGAVTLMTLHAAKGLEFPVVAMVALEEGVLPHARVKEHPEQLEEERRLCFVGITRAQEHLMLSRAMRRTFRGVPDRTAASRFLAELPPSDLEVVQSGAADDEWSQAEPPPSAGKFRIGQRVRHPSFGIGKIVQITTGTNARAVIEFDRAGRKTLVLEYARLDPVG